MKNKRLQTFAHVNIVFMLVVLFLLMASIAVTLFSARRTNQTVKADIDTSLSYFCSELDSDLDRITAGVREMYLNRDVQMLMLHKNNGMDFDTVLSLQRIEEKKGSLESITPYIKQVYAYLPSVGMVLQDSRGSVGNYYLLPAEEMTRQAAQLVFAKVYQEDGDICISYPFLSSNELVFMVKVVLSPDQIENGLLHRLSGLDLEYDVFIDDEIPVISYHGDKKDAYYDTFENVPGRSGIKVRLFIAHADLSGEYLTYIYILIAMALVFLCGGIVFISLTARLLKAPMNKLILGFKQMEEGHIPVQLDYSGSSDFAYIYNAFNEMNLRLHELLGLTYEQKLLIQRAEFKQLEAQINPHFLYNTLFMMNALIKGDETEEALELSNELGAYFKYITRNTMPNALLKDEDMHARIYASIQNKRFNGRIRTVFDDLPPDVAEHEVPRLIIQPLLENAYKHGLADTVQDGLLRVGYEPGEHYLIITVENNGTAPTDEELDEWNARLLVSDGSIEVTSSMNINRRICIAYSEGSGLHFSRSELGGIKAVLTMIDKGAENVQSTDR